jgi:hypothetical protein
LSLRRTPPSEKAFLRNIWVLQQLVAANSKNGGLHLFPGWKIGATNTTPSGGCFELPKRESTWLIIELAYSYL